MQDTEYQQTTQEPKSDFFASTVAQSGGSSDRKHTYNPPPVESSSTPKPATNVLIDELRAAKNRATQAGESSAKADESTSAALGTRIILEKMLEAVKHVDFHAAVGITDVKTSPKQSEVMVTVINQIKELAKEKSWAITLREGTIYLYNGQFWQALEEDEVKHFLSQAAYKMGVKAAEAQYYEFKDRLYKQLLSASFVPLSEDETNVVRINLLNGTFVVDQDGGQMKGFCKDHFLRYQLPFEHNEQAECPRFQAYLSKVLPEKSLQDILSEFIGYVFIHNLKLEKCLVLYGTGANGKSVFYEVSTALLGTSNVITYSLSHFKTEYNRASLSGKLLNYGSEMNAGLENDLFKQIASGEALQARHPYGKPFIIHNYAKLAFNANELPRDVEHTEAYFRRLLIVPFDVTIPEAERDPDLAQYIIQHELAGVFNWVLSGLNRLLTNRKFTTSSIVQDAVSQYRAESDTVTSFLADFNYKPHLTTCKPLKDLYAQYRTYCADSGSKPLSQQNFSTRLRRNLGYSVERKSEGNVVYVAMKMKGL